MRKPRSIPRTSFSGMVIAVSATIVFLGYLWISQEYTRFQRDAERIRTQLTEERKEEIQEHVNRVVDYIEYMRSQTEARTRKMIQSRVYEAHALASHIYEANQDERSIQKIELMIRESLRAIRFNSGRGYYFMTSLDGTEILFADRPELEGKNLLEMRDLEGRYVIKDMIELVRQQEEGFYSYVWTKPGAEEAGYRKESFIKLFEPLDCFIGTGEYLDDVEQEIQKEVLDRISKITFGRDGYIFAGQYDGVSLAGPSKGENMWDMPDANGIMIVQELVAMARSGGGFVSYLMPKLEGQRELPKISYARSIPDWQWYVGAGIYIGDIDEAVQDARDEMWERVRLSMIQTLSVLVLLLIIVLLMARHLSYRIRRDFKRFSGFFQRAAQGEEAEIPRGLEFWEFELLAETANRILAERLKAEQSLKHEHEFNSAILDTVDALVIVFDTEGRTVHFNRRCQEVSGFLFEEVLGRKFWDILLLPEEREQVEAVFSELAIENVPNRHINYWLTKSGGKRLIEWSNTIIRDEKGRAEFVMGTGIDITDRKVAEQERIRLVAAIEQAEETIIISDTEGRIEYANPALEHTSGYSPREVIGKPFDFTMSEENPDILRKDMWMALRCGEAWRGQRLSRSKTGNQYREEITISPVRDDSGNLVHFVSAQRDVTREHELEVQLRQSQKMEAVGQLAGGVAHDFNNLLQAIHGYAEVALNSLPTEHTARGDLQQVLRASTRASSLVRQLLAFSRREALHAEELNLNDVIADLLKMLRRILGEHIELILKTQRDIQPIHADPGQIEQILLNLCLNARDAMPEGGSITLETQNVSLDADYCHEHIWALQGEYVRLRVEDTGCGIPDEHRERIFEPFFTTKEIGQGTGLGLATVYAIVNRHDGFLRVNSEVCRGTCFEVYFPVCEIPDAKKDDQDSDNSFQGGSETILLAEDDEQVRELACAILGDAGYRILAARDGQEALDLFHRYNHEIDLAFLDVVMPKKNGKVVYDTINAARPELPVLFCSGYSFNALEGAHLPGGDYQVIQKPYGLSDLLQKVREVLGNNS